MSYPFDDPIDDMTDEEYADLIQSEQERPSDLELDKMFRWWEDRGNEQRLV